MLVARRLLRAPRRCRALTDMYSAEGYGGEEGPPEPRGSPRFRPIVTAQKDADIETLVSTFTAPALALALRDRESTLQLCARLLQEERLDQLRAVLLPFAEQRGAAGGGAADSDDLRPRLPARIDARFLGSVRRCLARIPRQVSRLAGRRASVVIPLCHNAQGEPSLLLTQRSHKVTHYKQQMCFPGGMVDRGDSTVVDAALREMHEELGIARSAVDVLGVLRCDWSEVTALTGVAVTPVVGFVGDIDQHQIDPNPDEVHRWVAVPLARVLDQRHWQRQAVGDLVFSWSDDPDSTVVWGLTAYILDQFEQHCLRS